MFFGGARGGGKTDGVLGDWAIFANIHKSNAVGLMVRRTLEELRETIERSKQIYSPLKATYKESEKLWTFPNGARLRFAYLDNDSDADRYQGHSYSRVYIEEAGNFPSPTPIYKLMATLRSANGVPCSIRLTGNPGGVGHHWIKDRYINPCPTGYQILTETFIDPWTKNIINRDRVYIPSTVKDNKFIGDDYIANLQMVGSPALVKAWLEGDFNVIAGAYFPEFSLMNHVIQPFTISEHWARFRSFDWGSYRPFAVGWFAVSDGEDSPIPKGSIVMYREWYGGSAPNVGLGLTVEQVADGIKGRESIREMFAYSVGDPSIYKQDGGPSIGERLSNAGVRFRPADNSRVAGWESLRSRLVGENGKPMIYFFNNCINAIRTLPTLQHDKAKVEDIDTESDDHIADVIRYACMSRPYLKVVPKKTTDLADADNLTLDQLFALEERFKRKRRY